MSKSGGGGIKAKTKLTFDGILLILLVKTAAHPVTIEWANNNEKWIILNSSELDYNTTPCQGCCCFGETTTKDKKNYSL